MSVFTYDAKRDGAKARVAASVKDFGRAANDICQWALTDAKGQLHPLLRVVEMDRLKGRPEFVQAFRLALEKRTAQKLASWQPGIQAIYRFDESIESRDRWDGSIHLLVNVPGLSEVIETFARKLDQSLARKLNELGLSGFQKRQSILEIQQVTQNEMRHKVSYAAMFLAVHTKPEKVWPLYGAAKP